MRPENLQYIEVKEVVDWVTNLNAKHLPKNYATRLRGVQPDESGSVFVRDKGTIHRLASYPAYPGKGTQSLYSGPDRTFFDPTTGLEHEVVATIDPDNGATRIWTGDALVSNWEEVTRVITAVIDVVASGDNFTVSLVNIKNDLGDAIVLSVNELVGWTVRNDDLAMPDERKYGYVNANGVDSLTILSRVDGVGINWQNGQTLTIAKSATLLHTFVSNNGSTPHIRWLGIEEQRKLDFLYGDSNAIPSRRTPIVVEQHDARKFFYDSGGVEQLTVPAGWNTEIGGGLIPSFTELGSPQVPIVPGIGLEYYTPISDPASNNWLYIYLRGEHSGLAADKNFQRVYITAVFNGYQQSDPIFKAYIAPTVDLRVSAIMKFFIDPSRMPKDLTSLRVWRENILQSDLDSPDFAKWPENYSNAILYYEVKLNKVNDFTLAVGDPWWTKNTSYPALAGNPQLTFNFQFPNQFIDTRHELGVTSLADSLGHQPRFTRERIQALHGDRVRGAGGTLVVLEGISSDELPGLFISTINGSGVVCDNNFTEQPTDLSGRALFIPLTAQGDLRAVKASENFIAVCYGGKIILHDLKTGVIANVIQADVASSRSVYSLSNGIAMAGYSSLSMLMLGSSSSPNSIQWKNFGEGTVEPSGSDILLTINPRWKNFYDGRLKVGATPFMTQAQRESVITGFDPMYRRVLFFVQVAREDGNGVENMIFRFDGKSWSPRPVPFEVKWFSQRKDNTLTIGTEFGILKYPNLDTGAIFEDDVDVDGNPHVAGVFGVEALVRLTFGELYSLSVSTVPYDIFIEHDGGDSLNGEGYYEMRVFRDGAQDPNVYKFRVDTVAKPRGLQRTGPVSELEIELKIPTDQLSVVQELPISEISLSHVPVARPGRA